MGGVLRPNVTIPLWTLPVAFLALCWAATWAGVLLSRLLGPSWARMSDWWWYKRHGIHDDDTPYEEE